MKRRERTYIAIIAALAIHVVVLIFLHEVPHTRFFDVADYTEVSLADFEEFLDDEEEPPKSLEELIAERIREDVANLVADANTERSSERQSYVSPQARDKMAQKVEGELREFERQAFEQMAEQRRQREAEQQHVDGGEPDDGSSSLPEKELDKYDYYGKSYNGNVTAEYELLGREARLIHIPGYKCKGGGVVKVNIIVNPAGQVVEANIDPAASSYSGDCLPSEALNSAKRSVFFVKSDAPKRQSGSITFRFVPQ